MSSDSSEASEASGAADFRQPLARVLANVASRPVFGSRRDPDRVFDRLLADAGRLGEFPGDDEFIDGFRPLLREWAAVPDMAPFGWQQAQGHVRRHLTNRAQVEHLIAEIPAIEQEPIERPVFVVGLPRTATTLTHSLLSLSEQHRSPLLWELMTPGLAPTPKERRRAVLAARRMERAINLLIPRFRDIHPIFAEGPEECTFALPHALQPLTQAHMPGYLDWHLGHDMRPDYRYLKRFYQVLQYGRPRRRWVFKSPMHLGQLDALREVFPDATLVWTHRDPVTVVASYCSLIETGMGVGLSRTDPHTIGQDWLRLLGETMARALRARSAMPPDAIVDVPYSWLGTTPEVGAPKLYEAIGAHWTAAEAARLPEAAGRPRGARRHTYDLARYGLNREAVEMAFADYNALRAEVERV
ncbi:sulfotransferase family protein [Streptomyces sp. NBC_01187]|uniref:sulfotransferase family protein n=1 Tax=Streptomyces sp. NBC_01187 TaxID=2903766 RepID=UPI00386C6426|nr:sulfotransferase [Streptomyces sp. NBC_01187]